MDKRKKSLRSKGLLKIFLGLGMISIISHKESFATREGFITPNVEKEVMLLTQSNFRFLDKDGKPWIIEPSSAFKSRGNSKPKNEANGVVDRNERPVILEVAPAFKSRGNSKPKNEAKNAREKIKKAFKKLKAERREAEAIRMLLLVKNQQEQQRIRVSALAPALAHEPVTEDDDGGDKFREIFGEEEHAPDLAAHQHVTEETPATLEARENVIEEETPAPVAEEDDGGNNFRAIFEEEVPAPAQHARQEEEEEVDYLSEIFDGVYDEAPAATPASTPTGSPKPSAYSKRNMEKEKLNSGKQAQRNTIISTPFSKNSSVKLEEVKEDHNKTYDESLVKSTIDEIFRGIDYRIDQTIQIPVVLTAVAAGSENNPYSNNLGVWSRGSLGKSYQKKNDYNEEFDINQSAITGGVDYLISERALVGIAGSLSKISVSSEDKSQISSKLSSKSFSLYFVGKLTNKLSLSFKGGKGWFSDDQDKKIQFFNKFFSGDLRYLLQLSSGIIATPKVCVEYMNITSDGIKALDREIDDRTLSGNVGLSVSKLFKLSDEVALVPEIHAAATYVLNAKEKRIDIAKALSQHGEKGFQYSFGGSAKLIANDLMEMDLGYDSNRMKDFVSHNGYIQLKLKF